jgi:hypothetical protein
MRGGSSRVGTRGGQGPDSTPLCHRQARDLPRRSQARSFAAAWRRSARTLHGGQSSHGVNFRRKRNSTRQSRMSQIGAEYS